MSPTEKSVVSELALLGIFKQASAHRAFPLVIEIRGERRASLRRVAIESAEDGLARMRYLRMQVEKAVTLGIFPGPLCTAVGLKGWEVNPIAYLHDAKDLRPEVMERKRQMA